MMGVRSTIAAAVSVAAMLLPAGTAAAAGNDFRLSARMRDGTGILFSEAGGAYVANEERWKALVTELGYVFSPRLASPAETLGHSGFHLGVMWSGSLVSADQEYWFITQEAYIAGKPNSLLQTLQLDVRKGLPLSFELGVNLMWLIASEMIAPGLEVRWTFHEGYHLAPDVALRGSVNHLVGNRDLSLTVIGLDAVISRSFGVGGIVNIAPYLSWSLLMFQSASRVVDPTPTIDHDVGLNFVLPRLSATSNVHQKLTVGTRFLFSLLNLTLQGEFQFLRDTPDGVEVFGPVATITTKLGLDY